MSYGNNYRVFSHVVDSYILRKWNSSGPAVLQHVVSELQDSREVHTISDVNEYPKTLGIEWNTDLDQFRLTITDLPPAGMSQSMYLSQILPKLSMSWDGSLLLSSR